MSSTLIARSPDLTRLRNEGYNIETRSGHLLVHDIPIVTTKQEVQRGTLVTTLALAGDVTTRPETHVAYFVGECPCNRDGTPLTKIITGSTRAQLAEGVVIDHQFSAKPPESDPDYYEKVTRHIVILSGPARALAPGVTAQTYAPVASVPADASIFSYIDTASSRAGIDAMQRKLELAKVAIVGLGGTGSYVLDLVAKTPVREIHLYDGKPFLQHNAFRSPGAPAIETLQQKPPKAAYWRDLYSKMRQGIFAHERHIDADTAHELKDMSFAFVCIDGGPTKTAIIAALVEAGVPFVDTGMGVDLIDGALSGVLRVTTGTSEKTDHIARRVPMSTIAEHNDYVKNIQIADLNALNAALAVVRWKKLFGFYADLEREHHCTYTTDGNILLSAEKS